MRKNRSTVVTCLGKVGPFCTSRDEDSPTTFVLLPHPSGLCREWNDPSAVTRARRVLEFVAPDVPWGDAEGDES